MHIDEYVVPSSFHQLCIIINNNNLVVKGHSKIKYLDKRQINICSFNQ